MGAKQGFQGAVYHAEPLAAAASNTFGDESVSHIAMSRNDLEKKAGLHWYERFAPLFLFVISTGGCSSFCSLFCFVSCCAVLLLQQRNGIFCCPRGKGKPMSQWEETLEKQRHAFRLPHIARQYYSSGVWMELLQISLKEENGPSRMVFSAKETYCLGHQSIHPNPPGPVATDGIDWWKQKSLSKLGKHTLRPCFHLHSVGWVPFLTFAETQT